MVADEVFREVTSPSTFQKRLRESHQWIRLSNICKYLLEIAALTSPCIGEVASRQNEYKNGNAKGAETFSSVISEITDQNISLYVQT